MNTVTLRNTSNFPDYELSAGLIDTCGAELIRSNKRTGDEVITVWDNTSDEELAYASSAARSVHVGTTVADQQVTVTSDA